MARKLLKDNDVEYREIEAITSEGIDLILKYGSQTMPAIIDTEAGKVYSISQFREFADMQNDEY